MRNRSYAKEVGLASDERPVPILATVVVFIAVVVLALMFARQVSALKHTATETSQAPAAAKVGSR